ncbi:hemagglutinin repeat-containing protein [Haemophilus haemolyticus]|uniref:hemagglutinin repeat-containing protein n=1 Tax=Haemophilus haemolyticus TaxID=726 RepID=UPI000E581265|nr:hemagglutinin repeat-containing protein [Haemophilus haemolyticus]
MAPRVYAMAQKGDLNGEGALISADVIDLRSNRLTNSGTIAGRKLTLLNTESLFNAGTITGDKVGINTTNNFDNIGGKVEAERALLVDVGGDLNHESTTMTTKVDLSHFQRSETTLARKALFHVKGEDGQLQLSSNNLNAKGADIINDGNGSTLVQTKNNVNLTALSVGFDEKMGAGNHYRHEKVEEAVVSQVKGKGDVTLTAKNLRAEGAQLESEAKLMAIAENDLVLNGAKESRDFEEFHKTKSGSLARTTKTSLDQQQSVTQVGTQVSGKEVLLSAGHDVKAKGIQAIAEDNLHIQAGHDVDIAADTNHFKNKRVETKKTSGVFTGGGIGITFGSKSEKHDYETEGWTQSDARSTLGSMNGNIRVSAGNHTNVLGTDMITPRTNQIDIEGASVKVEAGKDIIERKEGHEYKQSGLTIAVTSPVVSTAQSMGHSIKRSHEVKNEKLKQLHQMKAAYESLELAQNAVNVANTVSSLGNMTAGNVSNPSIKVSISVGASKSTQTSESKTITHSGSELNAGTVNLTSRKGDVDVLGSTLNAKRLELDVAKNLNVESVQDTYHNRSENKNTGWSVGVFAGANGNSYGIGVEGSAQVGKGHENSDSVTQRNSYLNAEETIIKTGKDANFKGAVVKTDRLEADIKGNLNLESRQDSNHYDSKQTQAGAGFSVAIYGSGSSAQANYSQNKAKVNYAQVEEQTGFHVGKGGMDVKVAGNTHLAGSVIDSEAAQDKNHFKTKSLTHTDIENRSEVEVKSVSARLSTDMAQNAKNAMATVASALGNKHESATSQTQSAIGSNIQIDTETPENLTALSRDTKNANHKVKAFDLQEIKEQQEAAQVAGELFSKITGDVAKAFEFEDGSKEKIAMHALAGALAAKMSGGNVATGAVAGASSEWLNTYVTDYLNEQAKDLKLDAGQKEKLKQAAQQMTALAIGAAAGAVTGGTSETIKQGALTSYNAETYNRQLHQNEKERIKLLANGDEEKERRLEIAACALIHCSAQIPTDDPDYAKSYEQARAVEQLGNTAEYAQERALLKRQTETFSDPFGSGVQNKLFEYNDTYKALDHANRIDTKYAVTTRAGGVVQAVGGVAAMAVGTGLCETGVGCVAGVPVAAYGADNTYTGARVIITGKNQNTLGGQLLSQVTGLSLETANFVYSLPSLYTGAKPILGATARLGNQVVAEGSQMASAMGYVAGEVGKDVAAGYRVVRDTATKTSVNTQLAYTDLVGKSVNGAREYVRTGVKNIGEQGTKVALANAVAAGGIKDGFEANDYANGKSLTRDNLLKSTKEVRYSFFSAGATTGMPILPVIGLGVTVDWGKDSGKYDVTKTVGSNIVGSAIEAKLGNSFATPYLREAGTNVFDKVYDTLGKENNEKK